jgi:hypothetical protein
MNHWIVLVGLVSLVLLMPGSSPGQGDRLRVGESLGAEKISGCWSEVERLKTELERVRGGER